MQPDYSTSFASRPSTYGSFASRPSTYGSFASSAQSPNSMMGLTVNPASQIANQMTNRFAERREQPVAQQLNDPARLAAIQQEQQRAQYFAQLQQQQQQFPFGIPQQPQQQFGAQPPMQQSYFDPNQLQTYTQGMGTFGQPPGGFQQQAIPMQQPGTITPITQDMVQPYQQTNFQPNFPSFGSGMMRLF